MVECKNCGWQVRLTVRGTKVMGVDEEVWMHVTPNGYQYQCLAKTVAEPKVVD